MDKQQRWPLARPHIWRYLFTIIMIIAALYLTITHLFTPKNDQPALTNQQDVIVILDVSASMMVSGATQQTRLDLAKKDITELLTIINPQNYGLILMAGSSFWAMPLSPSSTSFYQYLKQAGPFSSSDSGSQLNPALRLIKRSFCDQKDLCAIKRPLTVLVVSDGELFDKQHGRLLTPLAKNGFDFIFLTIDNDVGQVPSFDILGHRGAGRIEPNGKPLLSTPRPDIMSKLAFLAHGRHWSGNQLSQPDIAKLNRPAPDKNNYPYLLLAWLCCLCALLTWRKV